MKPSNRMHPLFRRSWRMVGISILLIVALAVAGCGGDKEADSPAPTDAPAAAAPTTAPAQDAPADPTATSAPAAAAPAPTDVPAIEMPTQGEMLPPGKVLKSFRAHSESIFSTTYADGTVDEQKSNFESAFVQTDGPFGFDESFEMVDIGGTGDSGEEPQDMTIISVGENTAMRMMGQPWAVTVRDPEQASPSFEVFSGLPGEMADAIRDAKKIGDETVNGVETTHYRIEDKSAFEAMLGTMMDESEGKLAQLGYDVWVAKDGEFAVKYQFVIEVEDALVTDADGQEVVAPKMLMSMTYELSDVNAPITIEWPAEAPEPGQIDVPGFELGQFPMPPETQVETSMFGITSMTSSLSPDEAIAFYTEALEGMGWTMEGMGGFYNWSKGDLSMSMVIGPGDSGSGSQITLMPGQ